MVFVHVGNGSGHCNIKGMTKEEPSDSLKDIEWYDSLITPIRWIMRHAGVHGALSE